MILRWRPGLIRAWRSRGELQLGLGEHAQVLVGLTPAERRLVDMFDDGVESHVLSGRAEHEGVTGEAVSHLLDSLESAGAFAGGDPAPALAPQGSAASAAVLTLAHPGSSGWQVLAARRSAVVHVRGVCLTTLALARTLSAGGVGRIVLDDATIATDADVWAGVVGPAGRGLRRDASAARLLVGEHPRVEPRRGAAVAADVTVLLASGAVDLAVVDEEMRTSTHHLAVTWRGAEVVIGPLVHPGASTCLRCVEMHRSDRDPRWPHVMPQICGSAGSDDRPEEPATAMLAGTLSAAQVLADLDQAAGLAAGASAVDATLEVSLATAGVTRRRWRPHPRCGCTWSG